MVIATVWLAVSVSIWKLHIQFPQGVSNHEQIILRWVHLVAGITWVGLLYFFNLVNVPFMKTLDGGTRAKIVPILMPRALWWFRWAAVVTWLAGFRYYMILTKIDASNAGHPSLMWEWLGIWFAFWLMAFAIVYALLRPTEGVLNNGWILALLVGFVVATTSWLLLSVLAHPAASNRTLSISVGGGLGTIMLLNVWGIIWRCQKKLIAWTKASADEGAPLPPEASKVARLAFLASRTNFWLSFPMLFFMSASAHYPFLSGGQ
jgi:uncharacterized membrane protein